MDEIWFYKGLHKVKVLTKSKGYWIVEALEDFTDEAIGNKVKVRVGEQRIVSMKVLHKRKYFAPPMKEHVYELEMEKKLKRLLAQEEKQDSKE